jgi:hypothetical protein
MTACVTVPTAEGGVETGRKGAMPVAACLQVSH